MKSLEELKKLKEESIKNVQIRNVEKDIRVVIGMATCGISAGARPVLSTFVDEVSKKNLNNVSVVQTGCMGMCALEPIVEIYNANKEKVTYIHVDSEKAKKIVSEHLVNNRVVLEYTIGSDE